MTDHDATPPRLYVAERGPERFELVKADGLRSHVAIALTRDEVEAVIATATEAVEKTRDAHEGNLRERARAQRLEDERQATLFQTTE